MSLLFIESASCKESTSSCLSAATLGSSSPQCSATRLTEDGAFAVACKKSSGCFAAESSASSSSVTASSSSKRKSANLRRAQCSKLRQCKVIRKEVSFTLRTDVILCMVIAFLSCRNAQHRRFSGELLKPQNRDIVQKVTVKNTLQRSRSNLSL